MITLVIPGKVQAQERPYVVTDKSPYKRFGKSKNKTFNRKDSENYKKHLQSHAKIQYAHAPLRGPLRVRITVIRPFLKNWGDKKKEDALAGKVRPTTRPDVDNYAKSILDSLNGITWRDDSQIVSLTINKRYGEVDGAIIEIEEYL